MGLYIFGQGHVLAFEMLEVPRAGDFLEAAVIAPGEAVERAAQLDRIAALGAKLAPAMEAGIVERLDAAVLLANEQEALAGNIENGGVASKKQVA